MAITSFAMQCSRLMSGDIIPDSTGRNVVSVGLRQLVMIHMLLFIA